MHRRLYPARICCQVFQPWHFTPPPGQKMRFGKAYLYDRVPSNYGKVLKEGLAENRAFNPGCLDDSAWFFGYVAPEVSYTDRLSRVLRHSSILCESQGKYQSANGVQACTIHASNADVFSDLDDGRTEWENERFYFDPWFDGFHIFSPERTWEASSKPHHLPLNLLATE